MTLRSTEPGSKATPGQESKSAGRPQTWEPTWHEDSGQYQIRKKLRDGKRKRFYLGSDYLEACKRVDAEVRPLVEGAPTLDNGDTTWGEALPLLWKLECDRRDGWTSFKDVDSRVRRSSASVMDVKLSELRGMRQKFWQRILDYGREQVGLGYVTQQKLQQHLKLLMPPLVREGWCDGTEQKHLTTGHASTKRHVLRAAQPTMEQTAAYLLCDAVPLEYRIEEWLLLDLASQRGMDICQMTWEQLGAPTFKVNKFGNTKSGNPYNDRIVSWYLGASPHPLRAKVMEFWMSEGCPTGDTIVFPVRRGTRKGQARKKRNGSQPRRKYYARSMGIALGAKDNSGHGGERGRQESEPKPSEWSEQQRELLLGSQLRRPMDYHSTRASFDTRLNRLQLDEKTAQVLTQHSKRISREAYDEAHLQEQQMQPAAMMFPDGPKAAGQNSGQNSATRGD